jgi:hypothetical protein
VRLAWRGLELFAGRRKLAEVVGDERYPGMFRVLEPDGRLSDMANLSRAKDAALSIAYRVLQAKVDDRA